MCRDSGIKKHKRIKKIYIIIDYDKLNEPFVRNILSSRYEMLQNWFTVIF